ncbi:MAG: hypothetical protein OGM16_07340 [Lachnospiraceae bacterium]|jgi:hypothetical protein|nr:MAG: hypothetical protein OGM16_07340 [Lachnospiraceae bacterium]
MQETNAKILKQQITNTNINISQDLTKKFGLTVKYQAELRPPKNEEEKTLLLKVKLNISSKDEALKIELIANIIFELSSTPEDYDKIAEEFLVPMARESLLNSLDDILVSMGYGKLELAAKIR